MLQYLIGVEYLNQRILISLCLIGLAIILVPLLNGKFNLSKLEVKNKASKETRKIKVYSRNEKYISKLLRFFNKLDSYFLIPLSLSKVDHFEYMMRRFNFNLPYVLRSPTAKEFSGFCKTCALIITTVGVLLFVYTLNPIFLITVGSFFFADLILFMLNVQVLASDKALEEDFPDLYLFLCPTLLRGSDGHISVVLGEFLASFDDSGIVKHKDIVNLVQRLQNLISIYGSELEAVRHLRDYYRTPVVINFVNLAIQSLNGVNNSQKILAYKQELCQKNLELMEAKGNALVEKGSRVIWLIFVILVQFIVLSWLAKCGFSLPSSWLV